MLQITVEVVKNGTGFAKQNGADGFRTQMLRTNGFNTQPFDDRKYTFIK